jgi:DNA-binding NtrC family response regulator
MRPDPTLLVIDDEPSVLAVVARFARDFGFTVIGRTDARVALADLAVLKPDAVMVDLGMPAISGLDVLRTVRAVDPTCGVILMTANPSVDTAIEAVKLGAVDYLSKPFDLPRLGRLLAGVCQNIVQRELLLQMDAGVARSSAFCGMIARSPAMQDLFDAIRRFAPHVRTVLVTGETGTGKELVARALHTLGARAQQRFVTVNCSAVVEGLFESELFGHERGAFTGATQNKRGLFEHADLGTLFLDEIGELPLAIQAKLLRAVEYGDIQRVGSLAATHVDVAVIAATNRDLRADAATGRFRSDLYYRLSVMELRLVPLRERREDIPYLVAVLIGEMAARLKRPLTGMTAAAERLLVEARWPGNVRELRNVIERAALLSDGTLLTERAVMAAMPPAVDQPSSAQIAESSAPAPSAAAVSPFATSNPANGSTGPGTSSLRPIASKWNTPCVTLVVTKRRRRGCWASAGDRSTGGSSASLACSRSDRRHNSDQRLAGASQVETAVLHGGAVEANHRRVNRPIPRAVRRPRRNGDADR